MPSHIGLVARKACLDTTLRVVGWSAVDELDEGPADRRGLPARLRAQVPISPPFLRGSRIRRRCFDPGADVCVSRRGNICSSEPPGQRPVCLGAILGELDSRHSTELPSLHDHVCSAMQTGNHLDVLSISADDPLRKSPGHENSRNGNMEYRTLGSGTPRDCARSLPAPASTSSAPPE